MKSPIIIIGITIIPMLLSIQSATAQTPRSRLILNKSEMEKLKGVKPQTLKEISLLNNNVRIYNSADLQNIGIDITKLPQLTLDQLRLKLRSTPEGMLASPLFFQKNVGQSNSVFNYIVQSAGFTAGFNSNTINCIVLKNVKGEKPNQSSNNPGNLISLQFKNAIPGKVIAEKQINGHISSYKSNDPNKWFTQIPSFRYLVNNSIYKNIKLIVSVRSDRILYSLALEPGAQTKTIRILVKGCQKISIDKKGNLVMWTSGGPIIQTKPKFYEKTDEGQKELKGKFKLYSKNEYGFKVSGHNPLKALLIDPEIVFASYFGGSGQEGMLGTDQGASDFIGRGFDIQIGNDGDIYLVGRTASADFPVTTPGPINGNMDIFAMRLDNNFQLAYSTFLGGSREDRGRAVTVTEDNVAYITGFTFSSDFPICPGGGTSCGVVQPTGSGAYIAKLNPSGEFMLSTLLGVSPGRNHPNSIKYEKLSTAEKGHIYVAGATEGNDDGTTGSFQTTFAGDEDGFVTKIDTNLSQIIYYSYLGGTGNDFVMDIDVKDGFAFVTGMTASTDFPTTDEAHLTHLVDQDDANCTGSISPSQCADAFITRFDTNGAQLRYSTYFGFPGNEDFARGIAVNEGKQAYITGASRSVSNNTSDIFVAKFSIHGDLMRPASLIHGEGTDHGEEIVVDQFDRAHITGTLSTPGLEHGSATPLSFHGGVSDIFYARFLENGENDFLTYLGGHGEDRGFAIATMGNSIEEFCTTIVGSTVSDSINTIQPLPNGETRSGNADILLFTLCDHPFDVSSIGSFTKNAPQTVTRGNNITFNINLINNSDNPGPVTVVDNIPACITNISLTTSFGAGCIINGNTITCNFIAPTGVSSIAITGRVSNNCPCAPLSNTAQLSVFGRGIPSTSTTQIQGCPPPPPAPPHCGNGICEPTLGENCNNCNDCPRQFVGQSADCANLETCESCPEGFSCRDVVVGAIECEHDCCSNAFLYLIPFYCIGAHCSNCGDGIVRRMCVANN